MRATHLATVLAVVVCAVVTDGCGAKFAPESLVDTVRILAVRADSPYALPGTIVNMDLLAFDGRPTQPEPMVTSWLPQACFNPHNDDYYECFPSFSKSFQQGVDLSAQLIEGTSFTFQMPTNVIASHANTGGGDPYGLAVVFALACAGHVEYTPAAADGAPDGVPFGCFDAFGAKLGADSFVFSYALVYAFNDRTNANPIITGLTYGGNAVDPSAGIGPPHCTQSNIDDCPTEPLDTVVPPSSQEPDPGASTPGRTVKEEIYVDYYLTAGKIRNETTILYDPLAGELSNTADALSAPQQAGAAQLWAVVHDDRGGVTWLQVTMRAQ